MTQSSLNSNVLTYKPEAGLGDIAAPLSKSVCDDRDNHFPFTRISELSMLKKVPSCHCGLVYACAMVRAIVVLPVPAQPLNQYVCFALSLLSQLRICCNRSVRVPGRQSGSWSRPIASNAASSAISSRIEGFPAKKIGQL